MTKILSVVMAGMMCLGYYLYGWSGFALVIASLCVGAVHQIFRDDKPDK